MSTSSGSLRITFWRATAGLFLLAGPCAAVVRCVGGLGTATHPSDAFAWGVCVGCGVLVGVGLAAGGSPIARAVHGLDLKRFRPVVRPAVPTAFLGYLLVIALLFGVGRPWSLRHPVVMWNSHSVLFGVAWCVPLYTALLALESSRLVRERPGLRRARGRATSPRSGRWPSPPCR